jgi:mRNA-degrading endonuclease RelE of RelBE toxin-antitoxin system
LKEWTVEITPTARRQYRQLEDGPKSEARDLLEDLEAEGPDSIPAIELRRNPNVWRIRFHNNYRLIYQLSKAEKRIIVVRIKSRDKAYEGMKH